jgi:hypothetical protein
MSIAALTAIATIGSTVFGAVGSIQSAGAERDAAEFNAKVTEQQAKAEREAADAEAADYRRGEMRKVSAARAMRGATGVTMAGSPLLIDESTVREVALGSARIGHAGSTRSWRLRQEAELERMRGRKAMQAGYWRAGKSLLSGFSSFGAQYA